MYGGRRVREKDRERESFRKGRGREGGREAHRKEEGIMGKS